MSIDITEFANATISVSPTGASTGNFGILGFLTKEASILPTERSRAYNSINSVKGDFGTSTEVYKAATAFYAQTPTPKDFTVITVYETDQPAILVGGLTGTVTELSVINAGTFNISIDGTDFTVPFDMTGITTYDDAAIVIDTALATATAGADCVYNNGFIVTSQTSGIASKISFATGTNSDDLGLSQHQGVISDGFAAETPVQALASAVEKGTDFIGLVTHKDYRDTTGQVDGTNTVDIADWAEANKKIFFNTTNDISTLQNSPNTGVATQLQLKTLKYTMTTFAKNRNEYVGASIFGRAASVNFEGINTTITLNLKQMPTITVEELTYNEFNILKNKNVNVVTTVGKSSNAFTNSKMADGSWLDTVHGLLWLENRIEVDMFNLLYRTNTKIPYTQTGINIAAATLERSLLMAVRNGLCGPGLLPDGTYLRDGYVVNSVAIQDVSGSDKSNRIYRGLSFKMVGAGALHEVLITGEFSE